MAETLTCFKSYDIRGKVPEELNEEMAYAIGRAYSIEVCPKGPVAVGRDVRLTSAALAEAVIKGLNDGGTDTRDIGMAGTEMVYFAAARPEMGGGIMVTASHNPFSYNGMKLVRESAIPLSGDTGLKNLEKRVREGNLGTPAGEKGQNSPENIRDEYIRNILTFIDPAQAKPLKLVINSGNGNAGPLVDALAEHLPFDVVRVNHEPDGNFPNGIPNPLLDENQPATTKPVREHKADAGIAFDGDFDRCFFFDENGEFVSGYYVVGLFAAHILQQHPGGKIIHDPRMTWNTIEMVKAAGGTPVQSKTGHAFVKERMRHEDAVYGGEMSAHHYFRKFAYCDSGMIPWLLMASIMSETGKPLSELIEERRRRYPSSGEINNRVDDPVAVVKKVYQHYKNDATEVEEVDGLSMAFGNAWRFNLRSSQTEPILRLNVESFADEPLMRDKTHELQQLITG